MPAKISPFLETSYGAPYGESGWNGWMDENLVKFSFLFDKNIDGIVSSLPTAVNGKAYFLSTDSRLYYCVNSVYYSSPTPKNIILTIRDTGVNYQFNGTQLSVVPSPSQIGTQLTSIQATLAQKQDIIAAGTANQYYRGDKTFQDLTKTTVGLGNVDNTSDANKPLSTAIQSALGLKADASSLASSAGATLMGYVQALTSAVPRTVALKLSETVDLEDFSVVDKNGGTDVTSVFNNAVAACTAAGKKLRLPAGVLLMGPVTLPAGFKGIEGRGKSATVIKFVRQTYAVGSVLMNAQNMTGAPEFSGFTLDCDDAAFKVSGLAVFPHTGTDNIILQNIRIHGRGDSAFVTQNTTHGRAYNLSVTCTGAPGATFNTPFYGQNCSDYIVYGMRTSGQPTYSGAFGISSNCKFVSCHSEGTSGSFGWSLGTCSTSHILDCTVKNSSHEAYQMTDCTSCIVASNSAVWDASYGAVSGQDAGISIHGKTGTARLNLVIANTLTNSFAAGLMAADNSSYNTFALNTIKDCGVRGTASGTGGTNACSMGQYTALSSQTCASNRFVENIVLAEAGTVTYGYGEFNQGSNSTIANSTLRNNEFYGTFTTRYLAPSASKRIWDVDARAFTPSVSSTGGAAPTAFTVNSASFRPDGDWNDVQVDVTITTLGSATGGLVLTWATTSCPLPALYQGNFFGRDITGGKAVAGAPSGSGVAVFKADATGLVAGDRYIISGRYRVI